MPREEAEDINFQETGTLVDEDIDDLASTDPELSTEVDDGAHGNDLEDADSESDVAPDEADKTFLVTQPDTV